jgi:heme-degrading monooxygenase HmoA
MIAVIFEVIPKPGMAARYFEIAASLKPMLEATDGFISVERFESLAQAGKYLSLSFWRDQDAVRAWRTHALHRGGQQEGRGVVLPITACAWPRWCVITACLTARRPRKIRWHT